MLSGPLCVVALLGWVGPSAPRLEGQRALLPTPVRALHHHKPTRRPTSPRATAHRPAATPPWESGPAPRATPARDVRERVVRAPCVHHSLILFPRAHTPLLRPNKKETLSPTVSPIRFLQATSPLRRASSPRLLLLPPPPFAPRGGFPGGFPVAPGRAKSAGVPVDIVVTGVNSRRISSSVLVDTSPELVWSILTDYDNLATHVPNLVRSERRPHPTNGIRLFQEGAQKIVGFDFRASLTMDMTGTPILASPPSYFPTLLPHPTPPPYAKSLARVSHSNLSSFAHFLRPHTHTHVPLSHDFTPHGVSLTLL